MYKDQEQTFKKANHCERCVMVFQFLCILAEVGFFLFAFGMSIKGYQKYINRDSYNLQQIINTSSWFIVKDGYWSQNCSIYDSKSFKSGFLGYWMNPSSNFSNSSAIPFYQYFIKRSPENVLIHIGFWLVLGIVFLFCFKSAYEKLQEPQKPSLECYCCLCFSCCQDDSHKADTRCCEKAERCRYGCWRGYKNWLYNMLLAAPDALIGGFNYDSECLQANTEIHKSIANTVSGLTFYLPFCILMLVFDDKFPDLLKCLRTCIYGKQTTLKTTAECPNYCALIIWVVCSFLFIVYLTMLAVLCFSASWYDGDTQFVAIYMIGETAAKILYEAFGHMRKCFCCKRMKQNENRQ